MKTFLISLLALLWLPGAQAEPPAGYPFLSYGEALQRAQTQNKPVFVYFGRLGCPWCDRTNKESFSDPAVRQHYVEHYILAYVDTEASKRIALPSGEQVSEMDIAARFRVIATPFFAYLDASGKPILRAPGYKTAKEFLDFDQFVNGGHYQTQSLSQYLAGRK